MFSDDENDQDEVFSEVGDDTDYTSDNDIFKVEGDKKEHQEEDNEEDEGWKEELDAEEEEMEAEEEAEEEEEEDEEDDEGERKSSSRTHNERKPAKAGSFACSAASKCDSHNNAAPSISSCFWGEHNKNNV